MDASKIERPKTRKRRDNDRLRSSRSLAFDLGWNHFPARAVLRPDRRQYLLRAAAGWPDRGRTRPVAEGRGPCHDHDPARLWRWAVLDRAARRPDREPPADRIRACAWRDRTGHRFLLDASHSVLCRGVVRRSRIGRRADSRALCRSPRARADSGPRDRQCHDGVDAGHHAGAAAVEFHRFRLVVARGLCHVGRDYGAAGAVAAPDLAGAEAAGAPRLRRLARIDAASGTEHTGITTPRALS